MLRSLNSAVSSFLGFKKICPDRSHSKSMLSAPKSTLLWLSVCYTSSGQPVKRQEWEDEWNFPGVHSESFLFGLDPETDVTVCGQKLKICSKFYCMFVTTWQCQSRGCQGGQQDFIIKAPGWHFFHISCHLPVEESPPGPKMVPVTSHRGFHPKMDVRVRGLARSELSARWHFLFTFWLLLSIIAHNTKYFQFTLQSCVLVLFS